MTTLLRWLLRLSGLVLLAFAAAVVLAWYLVSRSLPAYEGEVRVAGLSGEVRIVFDANAVPHIRAPSRRDAFFALGIVHAQNRLWQMELNRRAAQGTLSALFGPRALAMDRLAKTLDLHGLARRALPHQTEATRAVLEAYAEGVNAWIRHVNAEALGRGAPELFVFPAALAPWTPADSLAVLKLMALRLSAAAWREVERARFLLALPPERVADLLPDDPTPAITAPPRHAALAPRTRLAGTARSAGPAGVGSELPPPAALFGDARFPPPGPPPAPDPLLALFGPVPDANLAGASNAWAVDGSRSSTGRPLLAADPHLWLSAPSIWYLADVGAPDFGVIGGTIPGIPAVLIGRNRDLAWGLTTANVDDQDIFIERLNPEDPAEYLAPDGWRRFETRPIRIEVRGAPPVVDTVRISRHGPVLDPAQFGVGAVTPAGHVAALAWTGLAEADTTMSAIVAMMDARDIETAAAAVAAAVAPAQNVILADSRGVGMVLAGAVPLRPAGSPARGRIPAPGWTGASDWRGLLAPGRAPRVIRPPEGAVANANNRITNAPYPEHLSFDWGDPYRMRRLVKELSGRAWHSRAGFAALQNDAVSEMARAVLPLIARDLWWGPAGAGANAARGPEDEPEAGGERRRQALELLRNWTGDMDRHSPEPLIFYEWMRALVRRLAADELGPLMESFEGLRPLFVERVFRDIDGAARWCDVDKTPRRETCADMAALALDDALATLTRQHGRNMEGWRWGAAHVAVHRHTPLGFVPGLGAIFNIENETSGGDYTLLRGATPGRPPAPWRNVHAAGMRMVVDFADPDGSVMIASTGQSGHPFSRFYDSFSGPWARGETIPMAMDDEEAAVGALGVLRLVPMP